MMRLLRRVAAAAGSIALVAWIWRLRGRGGRPPTGEGWRELDLPETTSGS